MRVTRRALLRNALVLAAGVAVFYAVGSLLGLGWPFPSRGRRVEPKAPPPNISRGGRSLVGLALGSGRGDDVPGM